MAQQNSNRWDLGRFLRTLCYFEAIPGLGTSNPVYRLFQFARADNRSGSSMGEQSISNPHPEVPTDRSTSRVVFDFSQISEDISEIWGALDDVVMGGVSESGIRLVDGIAVFSGNVSTNNSGGFASVRTRNFEMPINLAGYDGIELRVKGDGQRYKFMLRTSTKWDGVAYCYSFDTLDRNWIDVCIPFTSFVPVFRARTVSDAPPLELQNIYALQLMLSKFEYDGDLNPKFRAGLFELQVQSIKAYGKSMLIS
ncbi:CIA30 family protein [Pseudanabaena sp. PCC 6802]|uniref:CIA30 family protein n=1 Tax=Pseudanabaena sp. PCC 6802 TaxID=118173 RepID=UPI000349F1EC|nr:CIA30 family protein [Pseudanabaena sp. PCC 6802]